MTLTIVIFLMKQTDPISVTFAKKVLNKALTFQHITELTQVKSHFLVKPVAKALLRVENLKYMKGLTLEKNLFLVTSVAKALL